MLSLKISPATKPPTREPIMPKIAVAKHPNSLSFAQMGWYHVVGPIGSFALWYFYLEHSKRVRTTYPTR